MECWTSSLTSQRYWNVHRSFPNQSICVLWIWKKHTTVSIGGSCGGSLRSMGSSLMDHQVPLLLEWKFAISKSDSFQVGCPLSVLPFIREGILKIMSLLFTDAKRLWLATCARVVWSWVQSSQNEDQDQITLRQNMMKVGKNDDPTPISWCWLGLQDKKSFIKEKQDTNH